MINKSQIFSNAHKIARSLTSGTYRERMSIALSRAWAQARKMFHETLESVIAHVRSHNEHFMPHEFRHWSSPDNRAQRVYFGNRGSHFDFRTQRYVVNGGRAMAKAMNAEMV